MINLKTSKLALLFLALAIFLAACGGDEEEGEKKAKNPYAIKDSHVVTLNDFLASAANGNYIVKTTISLKFSKEGHEIFKGVDPEAKEDKKEKDSESITPMQVEINAQINTILLKISEDKIYDKPYVEEKIKKELNAHFEKELKKKEVKLKHKLIEKVYIENYIVQ